MDFHDYIINYALQDDKQIQLKTSEREEFYELRGFPVEDVPKKGEFFNHQELFTRYLRQYDRIFNIHETGTGKTGSIIDAAETFKKDYIGINKVVIIEPGKPTLDDFKSQIVKFFPEEYDDTSSNSEFIRKRIITKKIDKWYRLETYEAFSNTLSKMSLKDMEEYYSDTMFFLDEAHRMRNYGDSDKEDENIYINLWKLLHTAKRTKIVVGTATPLVNSVNDFVPLLNLLLPSDYQLPIKGWNYSNVTLSQLEPFMRGKISFVRSLDTGVNILYKGTKIKYSHNYKEPVERKNNTIPHISKYINENGEIVDESEPKQRSNTSKVVQFKSDMNIVLLGTTDADGNKTLQNMSYNTAKTIKQSFELASRESSVFVFPDGSWGSEGFKKYVKQEEGVYKFKNNDIKDFLTVNNKLSMVKLFQLSSKFWFYINKELEASNKNRPGNSFCYIEFVSGSGALLLGLMLELFGFENFTRKSSVFQRQKDTKTLQKSFKPKKRFALITSKTENIDKILELFNSKENMDGQYLQIIIASKIARDGINLANVLRGYIMSPGWHESGMYQALSRFIRATSHKMLLDKKRKVNIDIFKLATCLDKDVYKKSVDLNAIQSDSIDVYNYIKSEEKDLYNRIVLRQMKNVAFDAYLNYNRNHREQDKDNTKQTDYDVKYPKIWSGDVQITEDNLITNTKKLLYYQKNIEKLNNIVKDIINVTKIATLEEFVELGRSNQIDEFYVYMYINTELPKLKIYDNFGNKRKIIVTDGVFFLDKTDYYFSMNKQNVLPIVETKEVTDISKFYEETTTFDIKKLDEYIRSKLWVTESKGNVNVNDTVTNQMFMISVLEDCIVNIRNGSTDQTKLNVYELFIHYINKCDYPYKLIDEVKAAYETVSTKAGRTAKKYSAKKLVNINFVKSETGQNTTFYHFFNVVDKTKNIGDIFRREDNMVRILKPNSNEFQDADINELPIFQKYYKQDISKWIVRYQRTLNTGIQAYGSVARDMKFRIIDQPFETNKGTVCGTNKEIPIQILNKLHLNTENLDMLKKIMSKYKSFIEETMNLDKITMEKYFFPQKFDNINTLRTKYFWDNILIKASSSELCKILKNYFENTDKLLRTL